MCIIYLCTCVYLSVYTRICIIYLHICACVSFICTYAHVYYLSAHMCMCNIYLCICACVSFICTYVHVYYLSMYMRMHIFICVYTHVYYLSCVSWHTVEGRGQCLRAKFLPSTKWILVMAFKSLGVVADTLTAEPSYQPLRGILHKAVYPRISCPVYT